MLGTTLKRALALLHAMLAARAVHQPVLVDTRLDACDFLDFHNSIIAQGVRHRLPHLKINLRILPVPLANQ